MFKLVVCAYIACATAAHATDSPSLDSARKLEKDGNLSGAVAEYITWLDRSNGSPDYLDVLLHTADVEPTITDAVTLLAGHVASLSSPSDRSTVYRREAGLEELRRNLDRAQQLYETAYLESRKSKPDYASLLDSAELLLELGETDKAGNRTQTLEDVFSSIGGASDGGQPRDMAMKIRLLRARIIQAGEGDRQAFFYLLPAASASDAPASLLLFLVETGSRAALTGQVESVLSLLGSRYPGSPEYALARTIASAQSSPKPAASTSVSQKALDPSIVGFMPTPARLLSPLRSQLLAGAPPPAGTVLPSSANAGQTATPDGLESTFGASIGPRSLHGSPDASAAPVLRQTPSTAGSAAPPVTSKAAPRSSPAQPAPGAALPPPAPPQNPASSAASPAPIPGGGQQQTLIQAGAFRSSANADDLKGRLDRSGLSALVRPVARDSETMYQVVVPVVGGGDSAESQASQDVLLRLKDLGIDGFLVQGDQ